MLGKLTVKSGIVITLEDDYTIHSDDELAAKIVQLMWDRFNYNYSPALGAPVVGFFGELSEKFGDAVDDIWVRETRDPPGLIY